MKIPQDKHDFNERNQEQHIIRLRLISFLSALVILVPSFTSCYLLYAPRDDFQTDESTEKTHTTAYDPPPQSNGTEIVYPTISVSTMKYTLSVTDIAPFNEMLATCKSLFYTDNKKNEPKLKKALYELGTALAYIQTQYHIAEILYKYDLADQSAKNDLNEASRHYTKAKERFWDFMNAAYNEHNSLSPTVNKFKEENYDLLVSTTTEIDAGYYSAQMEKLQKEMLKYNRRATYEEAHELFTEYIYAANMYAKAYGYENYYEFSTYVTYYRDYGKEERQRLRQYIKEYLIPRFRELSAKYLSRKDDLSLWEYARSERYIEDHYDSFPGDLLFSYIESLPPSTRLTMMQAFKKDHILIGDRENSYNSAFVQYIGDTAICFFHKDATNLFDVSHELGHYYAYTFHDKRDDISQDLKETHSQANTLLMVRYLNEKLDDDAFEVAMAYMIRNMMFHAITSVIEDEFEEIVFSDPNAHTYSIERLNEIMEGLIEAYDVADISSNTVSVLMDHWNRYGTEHVGYQISYTAACITTLQIYYKSLDDYEAATKCYQRIVEYGGKNSTFLDAVSYAGLKSPFDEAFYQEMMKNDPF